MTSSQSLAASGTDAAAFGFSPDASGLENTRALQNAVENGGTVVVSAPGTYKIGGTVYLASHTTLIFGNGVFLRKVEENGPFCQVLLNRGALTKTWDENIVVAGLNLVVNGVDNRCFEVYGLLGQIAFFYVKDLRIERFRCADLGAQQFAIHICTFEDVIVDDVIIKGDKDGVHFGRGQRFTVRNGVFATLDDAIALNAHDYATSNPELGDIEDGVIENCTDLADGQRVVGFFCRILAGAWCDWRADMEVQQSDTIVHAGRLYRVQNQPDGTVYRSLTPPTHASGSRQIDGINWGMVQDDVTYTAAVRNVIFRDIRLHKPRTGFSIHFDNDRYSRSYYPGARVVKQEGITLENVRVTHDGDATLVSIATPLDVLTLARCRVRRNCVHFRGDAMPDYGPTTVLIYGCVFEADGVYTLIKNEVAGKQIALNATANTALHPDSAVTVSPGGGHIRVESPYRRTSDGREADAEIV